MSTTISVGTTSGTAFNVTPDTSGSLVVQTNGTTTALTIDTSQNATFKSSISVGNTTPSTSGAGISFPATQSASTDANTLDDYKEGTWTPTQGSFSTWTSPVFTATYTKVGRLVTLFLQQTSGTVGWVSGQYIGGVPFTVAHGAVGYALNTGPSSNNGPVLIWINNRMYFQATNVSETTLTVTASYEVS